MWAIPKDLIGRQNTGNGDWMLMIMVLPFFYVLTKEKWPSLPSHTIATCFLSDLGNGQRSEVWGTYLLPGKWEWPWLLENSSSRRAHTKGTLKQDEWKPPRYTLFGLTTKHPFDVQGSWPVSVMVLTREWSATCRRGTETAHLLKPSYHRHMGSK